MITRYAQIIRTLIFNLDYTYNKYKMYTPENMQKNVKYWLIKNCI